MAVLARLAPAVGCALVAAFALVAVPMRADTTIHVTTRMDPPRWAVLERQLLAANVPAAREFFAKYFAEDGQILCYVRWGANDGPDDAFENFNRWPELHALGADDAVLQMYSRAHEGLLKQYTEARTTDVPIARQGMYHKEYVVQSDWMHHGEGLQLFNRMGLSIPGDTTYRSRARRFAGFYMAEDAEAPNYDPERRIIRSMQNGSRGPMLRPATAIDWVGDPFDVSHFDALHGESSFAQFLAHYEEYTDVVGDHFLNLAATTLATNAFLLTGEAKYKQWVVEYMDAWLGRMRQNGGIIPSHVGLDGRVGGAEGRWWGGAYGWGFSPVNPVTGQREDRNRIGWALPGFANALLLTGDRKYVDAWRAMAAAVNANARGDGAARQYPTMFGANGWYGWRSTPWNVGAVDVWYWSQVAGERPTPAAEWAPPGGSGAYATLGTDGWIAYLRGDRAAYPEQALQWDLDLIDKRLAAMRKDTTPADRRLADNMLDYNPAAAESLVQLMWGALMPGRNGGLVNARLRYFDPERRRAGVPEDVAALVSELSDTGTTVTLVNLHPTQPRTVIVQGGAYAEHVIERVADGDRTTSVGAPSFTVRLAPGAGTTLRLTMRRYAATPTARHPWPN
jgi:hypothetical protein